MSTLDELANEALDLMDGVRNRLSRILECAEDMEGALDVIAQINNNAKHFVAANSALEDIYAAIEDIGHE